MNEIIEQIISFTIDISGIIFCVTGCIVFIRYTIFQMIDIWNHKSDEYVKNLIVQRLQQTAKCFHMGYPIIKDICEWHIEKIRGKPIYNPEDVGDLSRRLNEKYGIPKLKVGKFNDLY